MTSREAHVRPRRRREPPARRPAWSTTTATSQWRQSPGGLVTAMESVMPGQRRRLGRLVRRRRRGARAVRRGRHAPAARGPRRRRRSRTTTRASATTRCGRSTTTSSCRPRSTAHWCAAYQPVNRRFAEAVAEVAAPGADRLGARLPAPARAGDAARAAARRADRLVQPHPVPAGRAVRPAAVAARRGRGPARRRPAGLPAGGRRPATSCAPAGSCSALPTKGDTVAADGRRRQRPVRASAVPISIDSDGPRGARQARRTSWQRAKEIRAVARQPRVVLLGVDRLDYTKGIRHRLKAYEELLARRHRPARRDAGAGRHAEPRARRRPTAAARARSR